MGRAGQDRAGQGRAGQAGRTCSRAWRKLQWHTWSPGDDVNPLLQGPAGLLGVGTANEQLTAQLRLGEVLLEAHHEVVGLLCQVLGWLQDDCCGLSAV